VGVNEHFEPIYNAVSCQLQGENCIRYLSGALHADATLPTQRPQAAAVDAIVAIIFTCQRRPVILLYTIAGCDEGLTRRRAVLFGVGAL